MSDIKKTDNSDNNSTDQTSTGTQDGDSNAVDSSPETVQASELKQQETAESSAAASSSEGADAAPETETTEVEETDTKEPAAAPKPKLSWAARFVLLLCFLLALAAAGLAGYLYYLQQQEQIAALEDRESLRESLLTQVQGNQSQLNATQNQLKTLGQQIGQVRNAMKKNNDDNEMVQSQMASIEAAISQITGSHRIDWMLREVEHFISVAEQRLSLLGDARGALALLLETDDVVRAMQEPTTRPLREALTSDIHALKLASETQVDVEGLFARIGNLIRRVERLGIPTYELFQNPEDAPERVVPENNIDFFVGRFQDFLQSLVRYDSHEKNKPILMTSQRDYLVQSVELLLNQAQLALLKGDNEAYQLSLREAQDRVDRYVLQQNDEAKFFVAELGSLASVRIRPEVPTIDATNRAVRVFREFWNKEKLIRQNQVMKLQQENRQ